MEPLSRVLRDFIVRERLLDGIPDDIGAGGPTPLRFHFDSLEQIRGESYCSRWQRARALRHTEIPCESKEEAYYRLAQDEEVRAGNQESSARGKGMGPVSKHARQEIAARIRQAVEISGLSREYICKTVGIDPSRLSKWENAYNTPGSLQMAKLVQTLNVDGHWLLTGEGSPHPKERGEAARLEAVRLISTGEVSTPTVTAVLKQLQKARALARLEESAREPANHSGSEG